MKIFKSFLYGMMALATLGGFASCQDDIDAPEPKVPVATKKANTTIFDLKKEFWDDATNYIKEIGTKPDGSHYIVAGRVITSDEGGNIFKALTIQDETAALTFSINRYNLFLDYRVGQEIVVDLTGMHIGKYNGLQQIGWPQFYEAGNAWEASFMAPEIFYEHIELNGMPEPDKVIVHTLNSISDIPSGVDGLVAWQSQLVRCNNIRFVANPNPETGEPVTTFGIYQTNMNQGVELDGQEVTLRISGYSDFVNDLMPTEACDAKFFLSYYGSGWQLMLMDTSDIYNIGNPSQPLGTEDNPYTVPDGIAMVNGGQTPYGWISGYIVGTVAPEVTNVTSNADIDWGTDAMLASTVVIAANADCREVSECFIVPLPTGSVMREYVAVLNHPENVGKQLAVLGTIDHYLGTYGLVGNNGTAAEFRLEGVEVPGGTPSQGDGTQANPYTTEQVIAMNPQSTTDAVESGVWVQGYIVGYYNNYAGHFTADGAPYANILISSNPAASDISECVDIQLVSNTAPRTALNLGDNPGMLGAEVKVYGDVMKYNSMPGIKNTSDYEIVGGGGGGKPDEPDTPTGGNGTESNPYQVGNIIAMNPQSTTEAVESGVWVEGYIVGYMPSTNTYLSNAIFNASGAVATNIVLAASADVTDYNQCIGIQLPSGSVRTAVNLADNPTNLGRKVMLRGDVMKYCSGPGIRNTSSYKFDGGGTTPDTPTGGTIFEESFGSSLGSFTIDNVNIGSLSYVWSFASGYGAKASAFVNSANQAADSWLVSPSISLSGVSSAKLSFDHALNYLNGNNFGSFCNILVGEAGTDKSTWTNITDKVDKPTGSNWTFVNSGNVDLSAFAGKNIQVGFHYTSTTACAPTWEVKNFKVTK